MAPNPAAWTDSVAHGVDVAIDPGGPTCGLALRQGIDRAKIPVPATVTPPMARLPRAGARRDLPFGTIALEQRRGHPRGE